MTAQDLLSQLREKGVEIRASDGDRLVIDAPKGIISAELRDALKTHKVELLQILKNEQAPRESAASVNGAATPTVSELPKSPSPPQQSEDKSSATSAHEVSLGVPPAGAAKTEDEVKPDGTTEEVARLEAEMKRLRAEEEARRGEFEAARQAAENALRVEQERWRKAEEDLARRRAEQEKLRIDAEARERTAEEHRRQIAEQEMARAEKELERMREMEEARRADVEEQMRAAQAAHEAELQELRRAEEQQAARRADEERHYLESEARKRAQEEELRRRAEMSVRAVEEEIERVHAREAARLKSADEAKRLAAEAARRRIEEEARRKSEEEARGRADEEARLRVEIEAQIRAEIESKRKAEEEDRRRAEEEARRRAQEEAERLAAERARRQAEEEARRRQEEEARRLAEEEARLRAEEEARRQEEEQALLRAQEEARQKAEAETGWRTELEARIRSEIEAKIRAEEAERRQAEETIQRRTEHERILAEEAAKAQQQHNYAFDDVSVSTRSGSDGIRGGAGTAIEQSESEQLPPTADTPAHVTEMTEWFDVDFDRQVHATKASAPSSEDSSTPIHDHADGEFHPVSLPETTFESPAVSSDVLTQLHSTEAGERVEAVSELPRIGGEDAFHHINAAFDDESIEVRSAAARALFDFQDDRAAAFTRALREASIERRRKIGSAIAASGLANEAIRNLTGEGRDKTYDAFSLLFLMSKTGEVQPLVRAIEEDPNMEVRLAAVKLLALSGQADILPAFRRLAVRGSLPAEVRSAVLEAIYQINSQAPAEAHSTM